MKGYWNRPDETAYALRTDDAGRVWFHTGDIARLDDDGFTTIVQRKKDLIIVDGFNVYPSDVEGVLYTHAAVKMAAVIGIPHPYHGEAVKACVVLREGMHASEAELQAHCAASLAEYKRPDRIEFRDSLPQSAVGKILYRLLRDEVGA
jgi:long-chain acyl-CoA synthetase